MKLLTLPLLGILAHCMGWGAPSLGRGIFYRASSTGQEESDELHFLQVMLLKNIFSIIFQM